MHYGCQPYRTPYVFHKHLLRSLYDSSSKVSILGIVSNFTGIDLDYTHHPLSLFIRRMLFKCLIIPATIPGTPATLSRKTLRVRYCSAVIGLSCL